MAHLSSQMNRMARRVSHERYEYRQWDDCDWGLLLGVGHRCPGPKNPSAATWKPFCVQFRGIHKKNMGTRSIFIEFHWKDPFSVEIGSVGGFVALMFFNRSCNQQGPGGSVCCQMDGVFLAVAIWVTATVPLRLSKHSTMMRQESQRWRHTALSRSAWWHPPCLEKHGRTWPRA